MNFRAAARGTLLLPAALKAASGRPGDITRFDAPPSETPPPESWPGLTALGPLGSERKCRDWALVLQSMGVWHGVRRVSAGWIVLVRDDDYERAATAIDRYESENRDWPPPRARERLPYGPSLVAPLVFVALALFFTFVTGPADGGARWFSRGSSVAGLVLSAEPWRAVTALTLHADSAHVLGNVVSGSIFATMVNRRLGPGGGTLAVVAAGTLGNVANAVWHVARGLPGHGSIGASTAVFGAVGLLAATQLAVNSSPGQRRSWLSVLGPIIGGLALLGALGANPDSDLGAHLFGLLAGVVLGLLAAFGMRRKRATSLWVQSALGALAVGIVVGSWRLAMG